MLSVAVFVEETSPKWLQSPTWIKADNLASEKEIQRRSQWERRIWGLGLLGVGVALILFGAWLGSLASIQYPDLVYGFLLIPLGMWFIARGLLGWRAMYRMG